MGKVMGLMKGLKKRVGRKATVAAGMAGMVALRAGAAHAGTDTTFDTITTTVQGWAEGSLGKVLAIGSLVVGGGYAVATQSLRAAVTAVGLALTMAYGPGVLSGIFTATF